jgi:hypothetical protein
VIRTKLLNEERKSVELLWRYYAQWLALQHFFLLSQIQAHCQKYQSQHSESRGAMHLLKETLLIGPKKRYVLYLQRGIGRDLQVTVKVRIAG